MANCGIITMFGEFNFGNRLQNYASQEVLKKLNFNVETIKYFGLSENLVDTKTEKGIRKLEKFKEFNKKINFHDEIIYKEKHTDEQFHEKFDYILIGSDQIWNYTFSLFFSEKVFASFSPKHKNISIAASFGVEVLPEKGSKEYEICQKYLNEIEHISVREEAGKKIVEELTGRKDVKVLVDPTMLLDVSDWENVMQKPEKFNTSKYILKCFLGDENRELEVKLENFAKEHNLDIIDVISPDSDYYDIGPAEFVYLVKNSSLVITDSFHSCVFSIIFNIPFIILERVDSRVDLSMYSRIDTLLSTFELKETIYDGEITEEYLNINYDNANRILKQKKKEAYDFLKNVLKVEE